MICCFLFVFTSTRKVTTTSVFFYMLEGLAFLQSYSFRLGRSATNTDAAPFRSSARWRCPPIDVKPKEIWTLKTKTLFVVVLKNPQIQKRTQNSQNQNLHSKEKSWYDISCFDFRSNITTKTFTRIRNHLFFFLEIRDIPKSRFSFSFF